MLVKNIRRIQWTNWDIVAVENRVKAGYMFRGNTVKELSLEEVVSTLTGGMEIGRALEPLEEEIGNY